MKVIIFAYKLKYVKIVNIFFMANLISKSKILYAIILCLILIATGIFLTKKIMLVNDTKNLTPSEFANKHK